VTDHLDESSTRPATVLVENHNWADMTVYISLPGGHMRLGVVPTFETATFVIPGSIALPTDLRFEVVRLGLPMAYVTEPIAVNRGERFGLTVENSVEHTLLDKRPPR
jgi:hypothetical protein